MIQLQSIGSRSSCKNIELVNILTGFTESMCIFNKHDIVNKLLKETISIVHQICCRLTFAVTLLSSLLAHMHIHTHAATLLPRIFPVLFFTNS